MGFRAKPIMKTYRMSKNIFITGISSGIGLMSVRFFLEAGYKVSGTVRKKDQAKRLQEEFPELTILITDLQKEKDSAVTLSKHFEKHIPFAVVNNAGYAAVGMAEEISMEEYHAQMQTNFFSLVMISKLAIPLMRVQRSGRIIQISSGFGRIAAPSMSAYCASKYAVEGFSEALRAELLPFGIYVTLIEPGSVGTPFEKNRTFASPSGITEYDSIHKNIARLTEQAMKFASPPESVSKKILEVIETREPRLRYEVGLDGFAASFAARFVPDSLRELALGFLK